MKKIFVDVGQVFLCQRYGKMRLQCTVRLWAACDVVLCCVVLCCLRWSKYVLSRTRRLCNVGRLHTTLADPKR
jgi:hypothetical protein